MADRKVLVVSHDASRTGAPFVLLHLLRWLKAHTDLSFEILLRKGGPLEGEFAALGPTTDLGRTTGPGDSMLLRLPGGYRLARARQRHARSQLRARLSADRIGLVFSSTLTNGDVLALLGDLACPVISYAHELDYVIRHSDGAASFPHTLARTDHYVAGSHVVKTNLVERHQVPADRITVAHEFIPVGEAGADPATGARIRDALGIPREAFIVGGAGTIAWRKGCDLFVQLARSVCRSAPDIPVHFVWVGGNAGGRFFDELSHDVLHTGLGQQVHFVGAQTAYLDYLAAFDVFALVSREDCFPLVMLEAALLGKPILCFDGAGGAKEFVEEDCGYVIEYLDVETMAERARGLLASEALRRRLGESGARKVRARHDVEVVAPRILDTMRQWLGQGRPR